MSQNEFDLTKSPDAFVEIAILASSFEIVLEANSIIKKNPENADYLSVVADNLKKSVIKGVLENLSNQDGSDSTSPPEFKVYLQRLKESTAKVLICAEKASEHYSPYITGLKEDNDYKDEDCLTHWVNFYTWAVIECADELHATIDKETMQANITIVKGNDAWDFEFESITKEYKGLPKASKASLNNKPVVIDYNKQTVTPFLSVVSAVLVENIRADVIKAAQEESLDDKEELTEDNGFLVTTTTIQ